MKNILILNGSPATNGNTSALVDSFTKGAKAAGNIVNVCNLIEMNITPCLGCFGGDCDKVQPCVMQDDMDLIYRYYEVADVIVFASPLYFWNFTGIMKTAIDRLFAAMEGLDSKGEPMYASPENHRNAMLLIAAEVDSEANFAAINFYYDNLLKNLGWSNAGKLLVGGLGEHSEHQKKPELLEKAYKFGLTVK